MEYNKSTRVRFDHHGDHITCTHAWGSFNSRIQIDPDNLFTTTYHELSSLFRCPKVHIKPRGGIRKGNYVDNSENFTWEQRQFWIFQDAMFNAPERIFIQSITGNAFQHSKYGPSWFEFFQQDQIEGVINGWMLPQNRQSLDPSCNVSSEWYTNKALWKNSECEYLAREIVT